MRPAVLGILTIDKGKIGLAIARGVEEGKLKGFAPVVERLVKTVIFDLFIQEIEKAVLGKDRLAIEDKGEARIKVGVVPKPFGDELFLEAEFLKDLGIGDKFDIGAVGLFRFSLLLTFQDPSCELGFDKLPLAEASH